MSQDSLRFDPHERVRLWYATREWFYYDCTHIENADALLVQEHHLRLRRHLRDYANILVEATPDHEGWIWLHPRGVSSVFPKLKTCLMDACITATAATREEDINPYHYQEGEWNAIAIPQGMRFLQSDRPPWLSQVPE